MPLAPTLSIRMVLCTSLFVLLFSSAQSFSPSHGRTIVQHNGPSSYYSKKASSSTLLMAEKSMSPNELFDSPGWGSIKAELDQVPIFAVANEEGHPIKYSIEKKDEKFEVPLFYTHVSDALVELEKAKENTPLPGMDINPYPLGDIFEMWAKDTAVIVPNKKSIIQAGAPPNANPMGQQIPLFACMEIAQENEKGKPVLPLFFELEDANEAVSQAVSADGGKVDDFEVVCLDLPQAVSLLSNENENAFQFIPPSSSLKHIRDYLSN